jgi:hypothetical protein
MEQILAELQTLNAKVERIAGYLQPRPLQTVDVKEPELDSEENQRRIVMNNKILVCSNGHYLGEVCGVSHEKYCPACGAEVLTECPNCGEPIRKNKHVVFTKYCASCGKLYPWWADGKMETSPLSSEEEELLKTNLGTAEILKKLVTA